VDFDAIVLAGGRAARLGGLDKATVEIDGVALLDRALAAVAAARLVVVVGDDRRTSRRVLWAREQPAYGGPVAATYAGLDALIRNGPGRGIVVVLAVDMPNVTAGTVERLVEGAEGYDAAVLSAGGRRHLAMAVRGAALEAARPVQTDGAAMRDLWAGLDLRDVPATGEEARDVDTPDDLPI
jgi:molybdopterin-guanine dinucleotide biosynthesis protein A